VHEALVAKSYEDEIVGYISRDSTVIEAREKPEKKTVESAQEKPAKKRGRAKKGEARPKETTRLERQSEVVPSVKTAPHRKQDITILLLKIQTTRRG